MKPVFKSNENSIVEFAKRGIYSFQVLIVALAFPFLFLFGISNFNQKKPQENEVNQVKNVTQVSVTVFYKGGI